MARGDDITHPQQRWRFRYSDRAAQRGWLQCVRQAPVHAKSAWEAIVSTPRDVNPKQYRLKGSLSTGVQDGKTLEQWQHKITAGGRLWYLIDDETTTVWLKEATLSHPKATE